MPALTKQEIAALKPVYLGPTWAKDERGNWILPKRTLGWEITRWCAEFLQNEDGNPWQFTLEQLRWLLWWYAVDEDGRFVYRQGVLQRIKGWGKDPLAAVLSIVEFVGPCRFGGWGADGSPLAVPERNAWVVVSAVSEEQTVNTMAYLPILMTGKLKKTYSIQTGSELYRALGGLNRLQAITRSYRSVEGKRTTFGLMNETHHWVSGNDGHKMRMVLDGNAAKRLSSRLLAITNAYVPGEDSVAETAREAYNRILEGSAVDTGIMYDSIEAHPATPLTPEALRIVLPVLRGDATWLDVETTIGFVSDIQNPPSQSRRMFLNQIVAEEDALYGAPEWGALEDTDNPLLPGDEVTLGFDGGKTDDATALVAVRESDLKAFVLGLWEKPDGPRGSDWQVPRDAVDSAVHEAFGAYSVLGFYADVALWESYISEWDRAYAAGLAIRSPLGKDAIGWDMRSSRKTSTMAHERLMRSVLDGKLRHDGDLRLRRHALNAKRRTNNYGVSFGKESRESPRKVDLYAALMLAHECMMDFRARGKRIKKRTNRATYY